MPEPVRIGQHDAGQYTQGFIDGIMAMAHAAKLDFEQCGGVVMVINPKNKKTVLELTVKPRT